jgi:uncharacterized protein YpuA (DUF1002 family)
MNSQTKILSNSNIESIIFEIENGNYENLIVDISSNHNISLKDINSFLPISKLFKKNKKSFVIVTSNIDFNKVSDKITVVPTLQEAHDIIEMEEIERDLENN